MATSQGSVSISALAQSLPVLFFSFPGYFFFFFFERHADHRKMGRDLGQDRGAGRTWNYQGGKISPADGHHSLRGLSPRGEVLLATAGKPPRRTSCQAPVQNRFLRLQLLKSSDSLTHT